MARCTLGTPRTRTLVHPNKNKQSLIIVGVVEMCIAECQCIAKETERRRWIETYNGKKVQ